MVSTTYHKSNDATILEDDWTEVLIDSWSGKHNNESMCFQWTNGRCGGKSAHSLVLSLNLSLPESLTPSILILTSELLWKTGSWTIEFSCPSSPVELGPEREREREDGILFPQSQFLMYTSIVTRSVGTSFCWTMNQLLWKGSSINLLSFHDSVITFTLWSNHYFFPTFTIVYFS